jgi:hypothetical protein
VIAVGGFLPTPETPSFAGWFPLPANLPVLHVIGRTDVVVPEERSQSLIDGCENSRVEYHTGGECEGAVHKLLLARTVSQPEPGVLRYRSHADITQATSHPRKRHGATSSSELAVCLALTLSAYITAVANGENQNDVPPVASFGPSGANTPASASGANTPRPASPAVGPSGLSNVTPTPK